MPPSFFPSPFTCIFWNNISCQNCSQKTVSSAKLLSLKLKLAKIGNSLYLGLIFKIIFLGLSPSYLERIRKSKTYLNVGEQTWAFEVGGSAFSYIKNILNTRKCTTPNFKCPCLLVSNSY